MGVNITDSRVEINQHYITQHPLIREPYKITPDKLTHTHRHTQTDGHYLLYFSIYPEVYIIQAVHFPEIMFI